MLLANKSIDFLWLALLLMTLATTLVAESSDPGFLATVMIAAVIGVKGRIVMERFMELHNANRRIRRFMNAYFHFFPLLIILVERFPHVLLDWTTLWD